MKKIILTCALATLAVSGFAEVKLPCIFGHNMVLQQQSEVALWGAAKAGATLAVKTSWNEKTYTVAVASDGSWHLKVATGKAGGPYEVAISGDGAGLTLTNVMLGEVWLCTGQSNMEMPMKGFRNQPIAGSNGDILRSRNSAIRLITAPRASTPDVKSDFARTAQWHEAAPEAVASFSATAYHFGKLLHDMLGVPVGLVCVSYGGSSAEAWMTKNMLADFPEIAINTDSASIKKNVSRTPTTLYNGMLNPVVGFGIRGCIWYQGESNYERADQYERLFPAMVAGWRKLWGLGDFPFYYAQIAPYDYDFYAKPDQHGGKFNSAFLRDAQRKAQAAIPSSGMAVLMDIGEERCIHPANKPITGERLALLALSRTYGVKGMAATSPAFKELRVDNDSTATIVFDSCPMGLTSYGKKLTQFEVAGADKKFHPASAKISSRQPWVTLSCPAAGRPVAVRYAFKDFVVGELFSTEGLPVSSFRTDDWEE
ncbi:MAG: sialate O-acetylesterase [Prevotellaceae bacterium]|jgi:sialate O-acetylesterase|nr:sialate O-acetylesterase [Prevotellaceae bacterium]